MVITRKIEKSDKDREEEIEKFILKGGQVSADLEKKEDKRKSIMLRFPLDLLNQIDKVVKGRFGMSRTGWILQAIQEKLEKND